MSSILPYVPFGQPNPNTSIMFQPQPQEPAGFQLPQWGTPETFTDPATIGSVAGGGGGFNFGNFLGTANSPGWGAPMLGAISGLASTFMGMKQYGLQKKVLEESKRQFQLNFDAQKNLTNSRLEDRQRARVASNPGAYQSVGDYMNQYRVGG